MPGDIFFFWIRNPRWVGGWPPCPDCSSWCLPGVPQAWTANLLALLLRTLSPISGARGSAQLTGCHWTVINRVKCWIICSIKICWILYALTSMEARQQQHFIVKILQSLYSLKTKHYSTINKELDVERLFCMRFLFFAQNMCFSPNLHMFRAYFNFCWCFMSHRWAWSYFDNFGCPPLDISRHFCPVWSFRGRFVATVSNFWSHLGLGCFGDTVDHFGFPPSLHGLGTLPILRNTHAVAQGSRLMPDRTSLGVQINGIAPVPPTAPSRARASWRPFCNSSNRAGTTASASRTRGALKCQRPPPP